MRPEKKELISDLDLNDIIDDYYDSIWSYSLFLSGHNPDAAEEITQEVFLCLIEKWHVIKKENVGGWLFGVARRKFYEYIKAEKKEKKHLLYYDDPDSPFFSDKNEAAIFDDEYFCPDESVIDEAKKKILDSLSDDERNMFNQYFEKKMTYNEIMKELGITYYSAKMRVFRLRKKIINAVKSTDLSVLLFMLI